MINDSTLSAAEELGKVFAHSRIKAKFIGGVAVYYLCPDSREWLLANGRKVRDLDLIARKADVKRLDIELKDLGYEEDAAVRYRRGRSRLRYFHSGHDVILDVFVNRLHMCHVVDFGGRLEGNSACVSLTELLVTKLQVVDLRSHSNHFLDSTALLCEGTKSFLDFEYLSRACKGNWGLWKTMSDNVGELLASFAKAENGSVEGKALKIAGEVTTCLFACRKSIRWRIRSLFGVHWRWYDIVESINK